MAAKFRKIDPRIWDDEDFERLDRDGKLLAFWVLTSNQINRCGICVWRPSLASEQTGIKQVDTVCDTVCRTLKWIRDTRSRCILLPTWWRYNQPDNEKALQGALSDLHDLPRNDLKSEFTKTKRYLKDTLHQVFDRVLDTVWDTVCAQEQEQEKEKEQEQEQKISPSASDGGVSQDSELTAFDDWWALWPPSKKHAKEAARKAHVAAVKRLRIERSCSTPEAQAYLDKRLAIFVKTPKCLGQYCPYPATWLNGGCYDDDDSAWQRGGETQKGGGDDNRAITPI